MSPARRQHSTNQVPAGASRLEGGTPKLWVLFTDTGEGTEFAVYFEVA